MDEVDPMSLGHYTSLIRTFLDPWPATMTVFVTDKCNARCKMCFNWGAIKGENSKLLLTLEEYKKISRTIGHIHTVIFSGGEPFLRPDLKEIINAFNIYSGTRHISIPTNCFVYNIDKILEDILKNNNNVLFRLLVGIDGVGIDHDKIRGVPGGFDLLLDNINRLRYLRQKYNNIQIIIITVFMKDNQLKIKSIADFVDQLKVDIHKLVFIRGQIPEPEQKDVSQIKFAEAVDIIERRNINGFRSRSIYTKIFTAVNLYSRKLICDTLNENKMILPCLAGRKLIVLSETGDIFPCELLKIKMGNVREFNYDIKKIVRSPEARRSTAYIKENRCFCTTECNMVTNIIYNWRTYPDVLRNAIKLK